VQAIAGAGEAAGVDDGDEGAQQGRIDVHGASIDDGR
jgi:hypothetical protein